MDEIVLRAMTKWPNVPAVFGWLELDRRGNWLLRGERIGNEAANRFISRNYACDEQGRWYFQNGPQRVFVRLHYTPWVITLDAQERLRTHTGTAVEVLEGAWVDEGASLLLECEHGVGLVHDHDLAPLTEALVDPAGEPLPDAEVERVLETLTSGGTVDARLRWGGRTVPLRFVASGEVANRFGFDPEPSETSTDSPTPAQ